MRNTYRRNSRQVLARAVLCGMLLVAVAGSRDGVAKTRVASPVKEFGVLVDALIVGGLGVCLLAFAALLALVARRPRRHEQPDIEAPPWLASRWSRLVAVLIVVLIAAIPVAAFLFIRGLPTDGSSQATSTRAPTRSVGQRDTTHGGSGTLHGHGLLLIVTIAAAVVVVLLAWQTRRHRRAVAAIERDTTDDVEASARLLDEATDQARLAIAVEGSPRAAVINAYVAMSRVIDNAADDALGALTPRRMLRRAADAGLVDRANGEIVIRLFERARFSTITITESDRRQAADALDRLQHTSSATRRTP